MTAESWAALSNFILAGGTIYFALTVGSQKTYRTWAALFYALAASAGFSALYHGVSRFHRPEFWVLVCSLGGAACLLFLAACACSAKPQWKWLHWLWPLMGVLGVLIGGMLAPMPPWFALSLGGVSILISVILLSKASPHVQRMIYLGLALNGLGLAALTMTRFDGFFSRVALFHWLQLSGYYCFWKGARR